MRKKTIVILYVLSLVLTGVAIVALVASGALAASTSQNCYDYSDTYSNCYSSGSELAFSAGLLFGMGLSLVGGVLGTIAWIGTLVKQGKQEQWGWFVCTLLFSGITTLIYLIVVPETPQYLVPTYVPVYQPLQPPTQYQPYQPQQPYQDPYQQPPSSDPYRPY